MIYLVYTFFLFIGLLPIADFASMLFYLITSSDRADSLLSFLGQRNQIIVWLLVALSWRDGIFSRIYGNAFNWWAVIFLRLSCFGVRWLHFSARYKLMYPVRRCLIKVSSLCTSAALALKYPRMEIKYSTITEREEDEDDG